MFSFCGHLRNLRFESWKRRWSQIIADDSGTLPQISENSWRVVFLLRRFPYLPTAEKIFSSGALTPLRPLVY
jgi:sulfur relay (sulfurtransferase) DsrC/TusE family protein